MRERRRWKGVKKMKRGNKLGNKLKCGRLRAKEKEQVDHCYPSVSGSTYIPIIELTTLIL